jgi:hypothetical protein
VVRVTRWAVVVPSNRPDRLQSFLKAWDDLFRKHDVYLIVVWDGDEPPGDPLPHRQGVRLWWDEGVERPEIPHRTDMIRSRGIRYAWEHRCGIYTLSLDDDVLPTGDVFEEYERVFDAGAPVSPFLDVGALTTSGKQMRGFPYRDRERKTVAIQYGGWSGVLDYDAATQLACQPGDERFLPIVMPVPHGAAVTGCAMNMAWRTEYAPLMWQLPLYEGRYNRFGDIWAGLFAKRVCDHLGFAVVVNGAAQVRHERASDPVKNLEREQPGVGPNEALWEALDSPVSFYPMAAYREVTDSAWRFFCNGVRDFDYAAHFLSARDAWLNQFA